MHAKSLIENGKTDRIYGFLTKNKTKFSAVLKLDNGKAIFEDIEYENQLNEITNPVGEVVGKCPKCDGNIITTRFGYGCERYKDGCKFTIGGTICGREIAKEEVTSILTNGKTEKLTGFVSKAGNNFDAVLKLDENKRVVFEFVK